MAKPVEYLDGARFDFDESFDWYAERSVEAAIGFALEVDEAVAKIVAEPQRFPTTASCCRFCLVKRYPFRVVYQEGPERIVIVAVAHAKRRPRFWRGRT